MKKRVAFLFLYIPLIIYSQNNGVYVTDVKLINKFENWCWSINQDRQENMIFGVERGVMVFDGINQELIKTPSTPLALYSQESTQKIWVSGNEFMGVLEKNKSATYNYVQLEVKKNSEYSKIIELNDTVYFVSKYSIQRFDAQNNKKIDEIETGELLIDESFVFRNKVYFIIEYFLNTINNNKLNELGNVDFPVDNFTYVIPIGNKEVILGTADRTTYIFNGKSFKTVNLSSPFFDNNVLTGGIIYSDSTIILSSLAGGIAIYNYEKSEIVNQVGYFNGLPDDEIRASFVDNNKGIWLSHEFGISRIDMNQGIESFGYYPGLKGSPIAIKYFNRLLYVATNDGLFILDEIKDYNEFTVMVNVPVNINIDVTETERANTSDNDQEESDQKRGLFGKRNRNKEVEKEAKNNNKHLKNQHQVATKTKLIKKRSLKSISKYFTLIKGMNGKYSQLAAYKNYLLVAGNNGLFAVKGKESEQILKNHYILDVYITDSGNEAYCATDNGLYRVYIKNNKWEIDHFAQTTNTVINSVAQEKTGNMVIASENMLLRGKLIKTILNW